MELKFSLNSNSFKILYFSGDKNFNHSKGKGIVWNIKKNINKKYNLIGILFLWNKYFIWARYFFSFISSKKKIDIIIKLNWIYKLLLPPLKITIEVIINKKKYW